MNKQERSIISLRGIMALLIVWHHLCPFNYHYDFGNTVVLFFFMLSGFGITISYKDKVQEASIFKTFIHKRISKLFPIQWLAVLATIILIYPWVPWKLLPFDLTLTQSWIPVDISMDINKGAWFLSSIFFCYIVSIPLLRIANANLKLFTISWIILNTLWCLGIYILYHKLNNGLSIWMFYINPLGRVLDFSGGMLFGYYWSKNINRIKTSLNTTIWSILEIISVLAFITVIIYYEPFDGFRDYRSLRYPIVLLLIMTFSANQGIISKLISNCILHFIGIISMEIYMIHNIVIQALISYTLHPIPIYAITIFLSWILSKFYQPQMERFINSKIKLIIWPIH